MKNKVLVLNSNWVPIDAVSIRSAMITLFRRRAQIVCPVSYNVLWIEQLISQSMENPRDNDVIITPSIKVHRPEIILLIDYGKIPKRQITFTRRNLARRDNHMCQYCGISNKKSMTIDHVVPRSRGGETTWENCALACEECNLKKADRTPREAGLKLKKTPTRPQWKPVLELTGSIIPDSWKNFMGR